LYSIVTKPNPNGSGRTAKKISENSCCEELDVPSGGVFSGSLTTITLSRECRDIKPTGWYRDRGYDMDTNIVFNFSLH
jgi:hypothetical protein